MNLEDLKSSAKQYRTARIKIEMGDVATMQTAIIQGDGGPEVCIIIMHIA
jgi:hypothetical protein